MPAQSYHLTVHVEAVSDEWECVLTLFVVPSACPIRCTVMRGCRSVFQFQLLRPCLCLQYLVPAVTGGNDSTSLALALLRQSGLPALSQGGALH